MRRVEPEYDISLVEGGSGDQGGFAPKRKTTTGLTAKTLSEYFRDELVLAKKSGLGGTNVRALAGAFASWKRAGDVDFRVVQAMIDVFVRDYPKRFNVKGAPAWKAFLAKRAEIAEVAQRKVRGEKAEEHRFDRNYWIGLPDE